MPFNHYPQPNVHDWKPDYDTFDQDEERILVYLNWGEKIICSWSSDERSTGGLVIAPEAIPDNLRSYFGDKLDPYEYAPGEFMQPLLFVYQNENNSLKIELAHPKFDGSFDTGGQVYRIHAVRRGRRRHSLEVAGYRRGITERQRRAS